MSNSLKFAVSSGKWTIVGNAATLIAGFLFAGLTIRYLGMERAGFAALVATFSAVSSGVGGLGLGAATVYELSSALRDRKHAYAIRVFRTSFSISLLISIACASILVFGWKFVCDWGGYRVYDNESMLFCCASALSFVIWQLNGVQRCALRAMQAFDLVAALTWIQGFGAGFLTTVLLIVRPSLISVGLVQVLAALVALLFTEYHIKRRVGLSLGFTIDTSFLSRAWRFGSGAYATSVFGLVADGADKVVLARIGGVVALPAYNFARKIYQQVHGLLNDQCAYLFPLFAGNKAEDAQARESAYEKMQWLVASGACVFFGGVLFVGPQVGATIVGPSFAEPLVLPIRVFSVVGFVHAMTNVPFFMSYAQGRSWPNFWLNFGCGAISLVLMLVIGVYYDAGLAALGQLGIVPAVLIYLMIWRSSKSLLRQFFRTMHPVVPAMSIFTVAVAASMLLPQDIHSLPMAIVRGGVFAVLAIGAVLLTEHFGSDRRRRLYTCARALDILLKREVAAPVHRKLYGSGNLTCE